MFLGGRCRPYHHCFLGGETDRQLQRLAQEHTVGERGWSEYLNLGGLPPATSLSLSVPFSLRIREVMVVVMASVY